MDYGKQNQSLTPITLETLRLTECCRVIFGDWRNTSLFKLDAKDDDANKIFFHIKYIHTQCSG